MDPITRTRELARRYFDGLLSAAELDELQRLVQLSPEAADAFARSSRLESDLRERFAQEQAARREAGLIEAIGRQERRRRLVRRTARLALAACLLLAVLGPLLWWLARRDERSAGKGVEVVSGSLEQDDGLVRVTSAEATLRLPDGTSVRLEQGSQIVMPPADFARLIQLHSGAGHFAVARSTEDFRVETPAGRVTALGTEFSVRLTRESEDEAMKTSYLVLAVAVTYGLVLVDAGGERCLLGAGESRAFDEERKDEQKKDERKRDEVRRPAANVQRHVVESVGDKKLTLAASGRREQTTIDVPEGAKVYVDGKIARLSDLAKGMLVAIERGDKGVLTIRAEGPTVGGEVKSVEKDKIVLKGDRNNPEGTAYALAKEVKVTIDGKAGALADVKAGDRVGLGLSADRKVVMAVVKESRVFGVVKEIDSKDRKIVLPGGRNGDRVFDLAKDVKVTMGEKAAKLEDVKQGTSVGLTIDKDGKTVTAILIASRGGERETPTRIRGVVTAVDEKETGITLQGDGSDREIALTKDVKVTIDGKAAKLGDLKKGDHVVILLGRDGKTVTEIAKVARDGDRREGRVFGTVKAIQAKENAITVLVGEKEQERAFTLSKEVKVVIDGKDAKLDDVKEKAKAWLTLGRDNKTVTEITIGRAAREREGGDKEGRPTAFGGVVSVVDEKASKISLASDNGDREFSVAKDAKVTIDGKAAKLADVKKGDRVVLMLDKDNKTATAIIKGVREVGRDRRVFGTVKGTDQKRKSVTVLVGEAQDERTFTLSKDVKITVDGKEGKLDDVKEKVNVALLLGDDKSVIEIAVRGRREGDRERTEQATAGKVVKVGKDNLLRVAVAVGREKVEERELPVAKDAKITIDRKEAKLEDVKEGMNVRLVLDKDGKTIKELAVVPTERKREREEE